MAEKVRVGCRKQQEDYLHDLKRVIHVDKNVAQATATRDAIAGMRETKKQFANAGLA